MFVPEIEIKKFEMVDVIATSQDAGCSEDDCTYKTDCPFD